MTVCSLNNSSWPLLIWTLFSRSGVVRGRWLRTMFQDVPINGLVTDTQQILTDSTTPTIPRQSVSDKLFCIDLSFHHTRSQTFSNYIDCHSKHTSPSQSYQFPFPDECGQLESKLKSVNLDKSNALLVPLNSTRSPSIQSTASVLSNLLNSDLRSTSLPKNSILSTENPQKKSFKLARILYRIFVCPNCRSSPKVEKRSEAKQYRWGVHRTAVLTSNTKTDCALKYGHQVPSRDQIVHCHLQPSTTECKVNLHSPSADGLALANQSKSRKVHTNWMRVQAFFAQHYTEGACELCTSGVVDMIHQNWR